MKLRFLSLVFVVLLWSVRGRLATQNVKCKSLNNKPYLVGPILTHLNLHYYPLLSVSLERCGERYNGRSVQKTTKDMSSNVFNTITKINEPKSFVKQVSCNCIYKLEGKRCNLKQRWENVKCQCVCKITRNRHACREDYAWNPSICAC